MVLVGHTGGCRVHKWCWWGTQGDVGYTSGAGGAHRGMFSTQVVLVGHTGGCSVHKWCWWGTQGDVQYTSGAGGAHRGMYSTQVVLVGHTGGCSVHKWCRCYVYTHPRMVPTAAG